MFQRLKFSHNHISISSACGFVSHWSTEKTTCSFYTEPNRSDSVLTLANHVIIITANQLLLSLWVSMNIGLMAHKSVRISSSVSETKQPIQDLKNPFFKKQYPSENIQLAHIISTHECQWQFFFFKVLDVTAPSRRCASVSVSFFWDRKG